MSSLEHGDATTMLSGRATDVRSAVAYRNRGRCRIIGSVAGRGRPKPPRSSTSRAAAILDDALKIGNKLADCVRPGRPAHGYGPAVGGV